MDKIRSSEITDKKVYLNRRAFIEASAVALAACSLGSLVTNPSAQVGRLFRHMIRLTRKVHDPHDAP